MPSKMLLRLRLPCEPSAPRRAREALAELDAIEPVREDALLVVSELTTNAVIHSGCSAGDEVELCAERLDGCVRITVCDPSHSGSRPERRVPDPSRPGGMGLAVVEQVARDWGAERGSWMQVWAELAL